ncbi:MAG TPA: LPS export ABC transporter permease LptF [Planctomycetes bacterium]|nr:LPS export ABC transporter permease LptF [Planctomycetota bacterium]
MSYYSVPRWLRPREGFLLLLDRYLVREMAKPFLLVLTLLCLVFAAYSATDFLGDAATGLLAAESVARLVLYKTAIALETLLPLSLFITVVFSLGRLDRRRELVAMNACGYSDGRMARGAAFLFVVAALVTAVLSLWLRPAAYRSIYALQARVVEELTLDDLQDSRFYESLDGKEVFYVGKRDGTDGALSRIFLWIEHDPQPLVAVARRAKLLPVTDEGPRRVVLQDLRVFGTLGRFSGVRSGRFVCDLPVPRVLPVGYKRKAASTSHLLSSSRPKDVAELQWRLTRPWSTLLVGFLAFLFGRWRGQRFSGMLMALGAFVAYYQVSIVARNGVEQGAIGAVPGLWWVDGLLALIVVWQYRVRTHWGRT